MANDDCHLKNLSFHVRPDGVALAPLHDLLCTGAYDTRRRCVRGLGRRPRGALADAAQSMGSLLGLRGPTARPGAAHHPARDAKSIARVINGLRLIFPMFSLAFAPCPARQSRPPIRPTANTGPGSSASAWCCSR
ncbi:HipA domain-containing protein [Aquabacterium sp.]|uniref:HipA domain-containing protein n=1 Tax=Aquabacterium sp. TaxID=1872578 RepID=UPI0025BAF6C4|nr:HipA domain-containing protein [Aquabacterium sp.]